MAEYRISGVWKDTKGVITHYAIQEATAFESLKMQKISKADAIKLLETNGNIVTTKIWRYTENPGWLRGENVHVVTVGSEKYLRSNKDNKLTDNLDHLINFNNFI